MADSFLDQDPDLLKQQDDEARAQKRNLDIANAITNGFSNFHSVGEYMSGHMTPKNDSTSYFDSVKSNIADPIERHKKLLADYSATREAQDDKNLRDPSNVSSKIMKLNALGAVGTLMKGAQNNPEQLQYYQKLQQTFNDPSVSAFDVKSVLDKDPLFKEQFSAEIASQKADAQTKLWTQRLGAEANRTNAMIDTRKDRLVNQVAGEFDNDTMIKQLVTQKNSVERATHTLQNSKIITPEMFNEIQNEYANAISGAKSAAQGTIREQQMNTLESEWAKLKERISSSPQNVNQPEVRQYLLDLGARLGDAYSQNIAARADQISKGRAYSTPEAQKALDAKKSQYAVPPPQAATSKPIPVSQNKHPDQMNKDELLKYLAGG